MNKAIIDSIVNNTACAFGKIGGTEGQAIKFANSPIKKWLKRGRYIRYRNQLYYKSGVFPNTNETFDKFIKYFTVDTLPYLDGICNWRGKDDVIAALRFAPKADWIDWDDLEINGMTSSTRWFSYLANKKILAISSMSKTIAKQTQRLQQIWPNAPWMHELSNTQTLDCPIYAHLKTPVDDDWFTGLERMCNTMNSYDFDICLIAAGAWSLPLAVHAKHIGKIGIHMGGALQLMYGIKGNRWIKSNRIDHVLNSTWIYPLKEDTPNSFRHTEDTAYWQK